MAEVREFRYPSANGENSVFARCWEPAGQPRAQLQILHGLSEHGGRYERLALYLNKRGFVVSANDHIGHGRSFAEGQSKGFFAEEGGWQYLLADVHELREQQQDAYPGLPYFMLGHSMGSFILRNYLLDHAAGLAGALLSGTGQPRLVTLRLGQALVYVEKQRLGARYLSPLLQFISMGGYNRRIKNQRTLVDWLSSDPQVVDSYREDPLCRILPTVGMYGDMYEGLAIIGNKRNLQRLDKSLPLLLFAGEDDPVGNYGKQVKRVYQALQNAGCTRVSLRLYPEGRHEMLSERNWPDVYADLTSWLEQILLEKAAYF